MSRFPVPAADAASPFQTEIIIRRSRFLTHCAHTPGMEAARAFVEQIRTRHADATHNCWAFVAGPPGHSGQVGFSDDGEPHGTAGRPMLQVLLHCGVGEITMVVTRGFGGVKLGTGGLVRAYTQAVKEGLDHCETGIMRKGCELEVTTDYNDVGKLQYYFGQQGIVPADSIYAENVKFILLVPVEKEDGLRKNLTETTCGKVKIEKLKETYFIDKE